ncbi:MAG: N-acetylmuramoyl-L-alanine amidase, partial [Acidimicrobiales bacterium]
MPLSTYDGSNGIAVRGDLGGLNLSTVPKVFIECANMQNGTDAGLIENAGFRQQAADSLLAGFTTYLLPY